MSTNKLKIPNLIYLNGMNFRLNNADNLLAFIRFGNVMNAFVKLFNIDGDDDEEWRM